MRLKRRINSSKVPEEDLLNHVTTKVPSIARKRIDNAAVEVLSRVVMVVSNFDPD